MISAKTMLVYLLQLANVGNLPTNTQQIDQQEAYCLAENIYYEARSEDIQGQIAVASVTLNRTKDARFPKTICGVVQQTARSKITNSVVCAFSWYCENTKRGKEVAVTNKDGSINQRVADQFRTASTVAIAVLSGEIKDNTKGATHFHNPFTSNPVWRLEMKKTMRLGNHDFYKVRS